MSKWSRRVTKYHSVKVEVGTYARIRQLASQEGLALNKMMDLLVERFEGDEREPPAKPEKVKRPPAGAVVVPVIFEE